MPQTIVKFCVYRGLGGDYSYSNMTNYFKMNNYSKFYCKTFIVTTAIMSDKRELQGYAVFFRGSISLFSQSELRTHLCHVRIPFYTNLERTGLLLQSLNCTKDRYVIMSVLALHASHTEKVSTFYHIYQKSGCRF